MKTLKIFAFLLLNLSIVAPAFARKGNEGSGGGNGTKSTVDEVSSVLGNMVDGRFANRELKTVLSDIYSGLSDHPVLPIRDSRASPILRKIFDSPLIQVTTSSLGSVPFLYILVDVVIDKELNGACIDHGQKRDAASRIETTKYGNVAHICFSVPRLTRYPSKVLEAQMAALFIHELTHLAGYGEEDAQYVQEYALRMLTESCFMELGNDNAPDGKTMGYIFYVNIKPGSIMEVKYNRFFTPQHADNGGNDYTTTTTTLRSDDFHFEWTPNGAGHLSFLAMSYDGSNNQETLEWNSTKATAYPGNPYQTEGLRGSLIVDGKALPFENLYIHQSCVR